MSRLDGPTLWVFSSPGLRRPQFTTVARRHVDLGWYTRWNHWRPELITIARGIADLGISKEDAFDPLYLGRTDSEDIYFNGNIVAGPMTTREAMEDLSANLRHIISIFHYSITNGS
ncbi:hypothetical protein QJS10_CPB21g01380 [Acorus calamus]|uniref:Uncharacterized protein n=1 Tax=Acorus calamus TaxID=4465 RepID=A0AAV9C726_ACOCL|nr:hypothetical protein QJS10_CPB21g01380 [Acorus calamus]